MADHVREQITVAALAALTGLTTTGSRVFRDRDTTERPLQANEVPGLVIEDDGDPSERISVTPQLGADQVLERRMRLSVTAHVKKATGYSAEMNQILKEVEIAMAGASLLGGKADAQLAQVDERETAEGGDLPTVRQSFIFDVEYYTAAGAPDVAL